MIASNIEKPLNNWNEQGLDHVSRFPFSYLILNYSTEYSFLQAYECYGNCSSTTSEFN